MCGRPPRPRTRPGWWPIHKAGDPLYRWLLAWADEAMRYQITYGITMDGALTDYQQVAEQYLEQMAAAWRDAPDWMPSKPEDVQPGSATVTQAYWGEGENFCTSTLLYIQTDPMGEGAGYWQAGSGLHEIEEGPYTTANGYYVYNLGRDFARNENGDWVCTGGYTGGEMVTLPTPVEEATVEQLVDYFFHTSGFAHDYSILNELSDRSTQELATLNDILPGCADDEARQFCAALGLHLSEYAQYHDLGYQGLYGLLDEPYRTYLGGAPGDRPGAGPQQRGAAGDGFGRGARALRDEGRDGRHRGPGTPVFSLWPGQLLF